MTLRVTCAFGLILTWAPSSWAQQSPHPVSLAGAVLPPIPVTDDRVRAELSVGRIYWPRVTFEDGAFRDLDHQPVSLSVVGEHQEIMLEL